MNTSHMNSSLHLDQNGRNRKCLLAGGIILGALVLLSLLFLFKSQDGKAKSAATPAKEHAAELVSATGKVFVGKSGQTGWNPATVGERLMEGDRVQTDHAGEASIRYDNGATVTIQARTIFTVRNSGDGSMEISVPTPETDATALASSSGPVAVPEDEVPSDIKPGTANSAKESRPFIRLDRIVGFGRSLELIGSVEAGSTLTANGESVEVAGNGSFKHFTRQFPASAGRVRILLEVADLAGRTRKITTTYDFNPPGGER